MGVGLGYDGQQLLNIRIYNEDNGYANFSLILIQQHGRKHIRLDTFALRQLHCLLQPPEDKNRKCNYILFKIFQTSEFMSLIEDNAVVSALPEDKMREQFL